MLGIGMQEILIILVVALIVIGPKRLPELARTLGKGFAEFRKAADDFQDSVRMDLQREKQEEFRKKHPNLVPDDEDGSSENGSSSTPAEDGGPQVPDGQDAAPEPLTGSGDAAPEPEPSSERHYDPRQIEGGHETDDDSRHD